MKKYYCSIMYGNNYVERYGHKKRGKDAKYPGKLVTILRLKQIYNKRLNVSKQ